MSELVKFLIGFSVPVLILVGALFFLLAEGERKRVERLSMRKRWPGSPRKRGNFPPKSFPGKYKP